MLTPQTPPEPPVINGHPTILAHRAGMSPLTITVCAECGETKNVIILRDGSDRYLCTTCGGGPKARRRQFALTIPRRRRRPR